MQRAHHHAAYATARVTRGEAEDSSPPGEGRTRPAVIALARARHIAWPATHVRLAGLGRPLILARRTFLRTLAASAATGALPLGCGDSAPEATPPPDAGTAPACGTGPAEGFLTDDERRALAALADQVLVPDEVAGRPGGAALGAVDYVEMLLTALDYDPPRIHAGGPYSGRQPFPDPTTGTPSDRFPTNDFAQFIPLSRVNLAAWRLYLYGSAGVEGGGPNDAVLGPARGLRDKVREGLCAAITAAAPRALDSLEPSEVATVWSGLPADFKDLVIDLVLEGAFAAPEYGGNRDLEGWKLIGFGGDSQPLGYSIFDETAAIYRERVEAPMTTANPGPDPEPMDDDTRSTFELATLALGGRVRP